MAAAGSSGRASRSPCIPVGKRHDLLDAGRLSPLLRIAARSGRLAIAHHPSRNQPTPAKGPAARVTDQSPSGISRAPRGHHLRSGRANGLVGVVAKLIENPWFRHTCVPIDEPISGRRSLPCREQ
ncbi:hypothetical protein DCS_03656 [Drechmeria coniospora]|uniref:Uncharacterized protein n=1 Tax=Drechmeria coniospora TaxID=98403 RepID=A0A151GHS7_DRECN|nr:hypothetical protein DCS_03656 [Drechmeria coniospora]KYK56654.1 hypothetical protein DCS_03656 [Drechmeria coniospora]